MLRHTHIACVMNCNGDCLLRGTRYIFKYNYGWQVLPQFSPPKINWTWSQSCSQNTKCSSNVQLLFCCTPQRSTFFLLPSAAHSSAPLSSSYLHLPMFWLVLACRYQHEDHALPGNLRGSKPSEFPRNNNIKRMACHCTPVLTSSK